MSLTETLGYWSGGPMVGKCWLWVASEVLSLRGCYGECNVNWSSMLSCLLELCLMLQGWNLHLGCFLSWKCCIC